MDNNKFKKAILIVIGVLIVVISIQSFNKMKEKEILIPSPALTEIKSLSDYTSVVKNSPVNPEVYIFEGEKEGGTSLILGGVHPNEPAGFLAAVVLLENIDLKAGRIIIIPRSNPSAFTHSEPQEAYPQTISFEVGDKEREFRFGSRITNPIHQWPDPDVYMHPAGQRLSGSETRNLNRVFPGKPDGNLTEKLAYGITTLIKEEEVDLTFDFHEASPEYPVVNAVVSHEKGMALASEVVINLQIEGFNISPEPSPKNLRGLSHREFGDNTKTIPFLFETANPAQGRLRGPTNEELVLEGKDIFYEKAAELGLLYVPYDEEGHPIEKRIGRHTQVLKTFYNSFNMMYPDKKIIVENIPSQEELMNKGVAAFLNKPE